MNLVLCFGIFLALAEVAQVLAIAGQSACADPVEIGKTYPHHFDPTKYWFCEELNVPAAERDCPKDLAYMHLLKECIPWPNWIWKKPQNPPTLA